MKAIRRQIALRAPVERVWEHLTNASRIAEWFLPNDFRPDVGTRFTLDCNVNGRIACEVIEVDPPRKLVYTFKPASLPFTTTVTFSLERRGDETLLTLVHAGWDAPTAELAASFDVFERGWQSRFLAQLAAAVAN